MAKTFHADKVTFKLGGKPVAYTKVVSVSVEKEAPLLKEFLKSYKKFPDEYQDRLTQKFIGDPEYFDFMEELKKL